MMLRRILLCSVTFSVLMLAATARDARAGEPIIVDDQLVFPPDANVPRYLTETERKWLETHPLTTVRAVTPPPTGPIHCAAEYEPMDAIVMTWLTYPTLQAQMGQLITTTGNADLYLNVNSAGVQSSANTALINAGANMSRVHYFTIACDTVWCRDYGPRYIFEGNCRALVDHVYNRPRPNDDVEPVGFASHKRQAYYQHPMTHGGGNMHLDASNHAFVTRLVDNENPSLTETQIHDTWQTYQNLDTHFFDPFPTSIDSTQHIDMWVQVCGDNKVMVSDWPNNSGSTQDVICDNAAVYFASIGFTVYRLPAFSVGGTHYTYTNVCICNNLVMVPSYTNGTVSPSNATALATWQTAMPGKTVVAVPCQTIITAAGAMHCIVSHMPTHRGAAGPNGGLAPTAYLKNLRGGDTLTPGSHVAINWISDDDVATTTADILLSTDGGQNYSPIVTGLADYTNWTYNWTVPNIFTPHARIKVVVHDAPGNTGFDASPADFLINGTPALGDLDCSGAVDLNDVDLFVAALMDQNSFTGCNINLADMNADTFIDGNDVAGFVQAVAP